MHCIQAKKQSMHFAQPHHWFNGNGRSCNNDYTPSLHNVDAATAHDDVVTDTDASADIGVAFGDAGDNNNNDDNSNSDKNCNDHDNMRVLLEFEHIHSKDIIYIDLKREDLLSFCCPFPITEAALFIFLLAYFHLCVIEI
ncbi:hypothetical protein RFI_38652 [Reticulomyxa filosa]|uniref:Uncharacterized protein n=1 Tax=Reticulomyxa filosa TaxID=46433 RepID=X6LBV9_RETFI|nr:hypothetical protein RFI_38652 [Reticulomyxa filosa]|eukprot:ETN98835.1 hypothetical protein RFI_38652 [Reticulomyxa filosa]